MLIRSERFKINELTRKKKLETSEMALMVLCRFVSGFSRGPSDSTRIRPSSVKFPDITRSVKSVLRLNVAERDKRFSMGFMR